jgi:hypothetical protein
MRAAAIGKTPYELMAQFANDGYDVDPDNDVVTFEDKVGIRATSQTAGIGPTGLNKKVYYVEGNGRQMGYLLGRLASVDIYYMSTDFVANIMFGFLGIDDPAMQQRLRSTLLDFGYWLARPIRQDIPQEYLDEIQGLIAGCQDCEPAPAVTEQGLWLLNFGFDALMSFAYTGRVPIHKLDTLAVRPEQLRLPIMCNGFCATGTGPQGTYYYMGRDFQFSTGGVFQDSATTIIRVPEQGLPTISVTAPGIVGTIAGLNVNGVGVGVDMLPAANCNVWRPGFNSLTLMRHIIQYGGSGADAVRLIQQAQRGVSWIYLVGDAQAGDGYVVETGMSSPAYDGLASMPPDMHAAAIAACPDFDDLVNACASLSFQNGMTARPLGYEYPKANAFLDAVNPALINAYRVRQPSYAYQFNPADFGERGFINKTGADANCPGPFYFAPQRESRSDLVLGTNGAIAPHMRLYGMADWVSRVSAPRLDDIQLRYDKLNNALLGTLDKGYLTYDEAKGIISNSGATLRSGGTIGGAVSLMDLPNKTIESHYGYEADAWIKLKLTDYV